ncbi:translation initiation factor IF-2 [Micractinium conductrix]|uniref:Translation initiation factor IF-2 n=1 Tax=Micractinium conductrix TaxID=554055 RepID=A0A2P6VS76_9CHLO|nr:translation initiation factor IF-2 [Micractinium conductrix]|eukprot:PSC76935.1 translation initiation factor IF-2 [Micractinium conductrix]
MMKAAAVLLALVCCAQCASASRLFLKREEFRGEQARRGLLSAVGLGGYGAYGQSVGGYGAYGQTIGSYGAYGGARRLSSVDSTQTRELQWAGSYGAYGQSTGGYGAYGQSTGGYGAYGLRRLSSVILSSTRALLWGGYGAYGQSTGGYGAYGQSTGGYGAYGMRRLSGWSASGPSRDLLWGGYGAYGQTTGGYGAYGQTIGSYGAAGGTVVVVRANSGGWLSSNGGGARPRAAAAAPRCHTTSAPRQRPACGPPCHLCDRRRCCTPPATHGIGSALACANRAGANRKPRLSPGLAARLGEACTSSSASSSLAAPPRTQGAALAQPARAALQQQQARAVTNGIAVDVPNGNVDRAWRVLTRKVREEAVLSKAQGRQFYEKPSEQRKKAASLAERRFKRAEFQEMLGWIMRRRSRGF